ncbi:hypothetical protein H6P81_015416 [Aristolochia fimbriata]|uniref:Uncharacterized protein n=1 Tax=Aristolochia fimbriata TaxID=158543 RepID=A0AAV7E8D2_ARIFI|nr:hypothetical protein H6P81_015416 [Aristolochia fimbriata]
MKVIQMTILGKIASRLKEFFIKIISNRAKKSLIYLWFWMKLLDAITGVLREVWGVAGHGGVTNTEGHLMGGLRLSPYREEIRAMESRVQATFQEQLQAQAKWFMDIIMTPLSTFDYSSTQDEVLACA